MPPPSATEVLARACCLAASIRRLWLEHRVEGRRPKETAGSGPRAIARLLGELRDQRALPALTKAERRLLEKPAGRLNDADRLNAGWSIEGARRAGLGAGTGRGASRVRRDVRARGPQAFLQAPSGNTLRAAEVLGRARDEAERWHWRSNQTQGYFRIPGTSSGPMEMPLDEEQRAKQVRRALGEEVSLYGKAYPRLTGREFSLHRLNRDRAAPRAEVALRRRRVGRRGARADASRPLTSRVPRCERGPAGSRSSSSGSTRSFEAHFAEGIVRCRRGWSAASSCSSAAGASPPTSRGRSGSAPGRGRRPSSPPGARHTRTR